MSYKSNGLEFLYRKDMTPDSSFDNPKAWHFKLLSAAAFLALIGLLMWDYLVDGDMEGDRRVKLGIAWYVASGIPFLFLTYDFYQKRKIAYFYQWLVWGSLTAGGVMWIEALIKPDEQKFRIVAGSLIGSYAFLKSSASYYRVYLEQRRNDGVSYKNGSDWYWVVDTHIPPKSLLLRSGIVLIIVGGFLAQVALFLYEYIIDTSTGIAAHVFGIPAYISLGTLTIVTMYDYSMYGKTDRKWTFFMRLLLSAVSTTFAVLWIQARSTDNALLKQIVVALGSFVLLFTVLLPGVLVATGKISTAEYQKLNQDAMI
jgi:hypothetical protein